MTSSDVLARFRECPILIVGDLMLDEFVWGHVSRISPEAPVPVVEVNRRTWIPGGAANTAANIGGLGGKAILAGVVGDDADGTRIRELLAAQGVATGPVVRDAARDSVTGAADAPPQVEVIS